MSSAFLDGPRLSPLSGQPARQLVVLLHGYGADGDDLIQLAKIWQPQLAHAAFIAPHAPEECELTPFGRQWFSLNRYDPTLSRRDPHAIEQALDALTPGAETAAPKIEAFLDAELERLSLGWQDLALVGFSQGTMMALYTALRHPVGPAGILGYSGALVAPGTLARDIRCKPPVCLIHGEEDDILPIAALEHARRVLQSLSVPVETTARPSLSHGIDETGLALGQRFLGGLFNG
ncbi:alpha/beta hydrolase [Sneathiella chinensis]|uniref:Phospholipase/carboxylesterase n=1 Tax=Sneathiella chinensis TaxID=349750 RepID=A0ABQ5U242_9PROT|nr:alpha/beta fold hydrolase [Sneathiella chinensis]GLQ05328.1 phospholipase/carboxylesterase [Sneathiella chinensis]